MRLSAVLLIAALVVQAPFLVRTAGAQTVPAAITTDPAPDPKNPARLEVVHVPTVGGLKVNGVVFVPSGAGPHPTVVLFHGLPGNEKNYDLAQTLRRAGWTVLSINYRGSWGSPGAYSFAGDLEDAKAALAFVRDPANASLGFDGRRIVVIGHSLGGWVTAHTVAADPGVLGGVMISAGDMGLLGVAAKMSREKAVAAIADMHETLTTSPQDMAAEVAAHATEFGFSAAVPALAQRRLLVLYSNDFVKAHSESLIRQLKAAGDTTLDTAYADTDHSWDDHRITLQILILDWLARLPGARAP
jgi:pimeloyl-ACP methyl ester carboxylesterase